MLVSQELAVIDHEMNDTSTADVVRQHFADFVRCVVGTPGQLDPLEAYPVPYPDAAMEGHPALPPEHREWEQERDNMIEWFTSLYLWQGGSVGPDWDRIQGDIDKEQYVTIDQHRLPPEQIPFKNPNDWDEGTTRAWSRHIRSTMNQSGCVDPGLTESAFQFRALYDEDGNLLSEDVAFRTQCAKGTALEYSVLCYMYAQRIARTAPAPGAATQDRANELYPLRFNAQVQEAAVLVPKLEDLWDNVRAYESKSPPQAAVPSETEFAAWPRAAQHIIQDPERFISNYTQWEYPDHFVNLDSDEWSSWDIPSFSRWIGSNPFLNRSTQLQGGGYHGVCVVFLALLQYCWNIARVRPSDDATAAHMVQQGRAVYGPQDLYFLSRSALTLGRLICEAIPLLPQGAPMLESDHKMRRESWSPDAWFEISPGSAEQELPRDQLDRSRRPAFNVFACTFDNQTSTTDGDQTASEESQPDSAHPTVMPGQEGNHQSGNDSQLGHYATWYARMMARLTTTREADPGTVESMDLDVPDAPAESTHVMRPVYPTMPVDYQKVFKL
ncbi:hypothetical protein FRC06_000354 [Ceratobasidium sp. 370]|nr:hypothetical protein FRC06_000354 [Ceratobasidium sp. 370]